MTNMKTNSENSADKLSKKNTNNLVENDAINAEIFFNEFLDAAADCFLILDSSFKIVDIGDYAEKLTLYSKSELLNFSFFDLFTPESRGVVVESFVKIKNCGKIFFEAEILRNDNQKRYVEINAKFLPNFQNSIIGFLTDITSKKFERDTYIRLLQHNENKLKTFFDNTLNLIVISDMDLRIIEVNDKTCAFSGYTRDELLSFSISDIFCPDKTENVLPVINQLFTSGPLEKDCILVKKNREKLPIHLYLNTFNFENNPFIFFNGIDLSDKIYAEKSLQKSEKRFKDIFTKMLDGFAIHKIILDENNLPVDYVFIDVNPAFEKLTGLNKNDIIGKNVSEIFPHLEKYWLDTYSDVALNDKVVQFENFSSDIGKYFKVTAYSPEKYFFATIFEDVTEETAAKSELEINRKKLEELNKMKDKYLSIVAHDLRNPFHSIMGFSELLIINDKKYTTDKKLRMLQTIYDSSKSANKLLENLLLWSRFQRGTIRPIPEFLKLSEIVNESIEFILSSSLIKHILVINKIDESIYIYVDKDMMHTVFRNLLSNSVKFSKPNSKVDIFANELADFVEISVQDFGYGMSEDDLSKLFRIDVKSSEIGKHIDDKEKGSGLGLVLCKEFIEANKGKLSVTSTIGVGSTFTITLPTTGNLQ